MVVDERARRRRAPSISPPDKIAVKVPTDSLFDALVPPDLRHLSSVHWTPATIALHAVRWLAPQKGVRVLDVGSGVGKLCAIGALAVDATWCGIETNVYLATAATEIACALGVAERTRFLVGDALSIDWSSFDALYFYNPFELPLFGTDGGGHVRPTRDSSLYLELVTARLRSLGPDTRVVTFHGFGGEMPDGYDLRARRTTPLGELDLWVRRDA
jgi:hypothetical protein